MTDLSARVEATQGCVAALVGEAGQVQETPTTGEAAAAGAERRAQALREAIAAAEADLAVRQPTRAGLEARLAEATRAVGWSPCRHAP